MANIYPYIPSFTSCFAIETLSFPVKVFGDGPRKITAVAPLYSKPSVTKSGGVLVNPTAHSLLLDSNILSFAENDEKHEHVGELFRWANTNNMVVSPVVAIMEQFNQDIPEETSAGFVRKKVRILNERYGANIDVVWMEYALTMAPLMIKQNRDYIGILADFFIVVQDLYHKKTTFEKKCKLLASVTRENFPPLSIAYYIACLYFYVGSNPKLFPDGKRKCQADMERSKNSTKTRSNIGNFSSDISMITGSSMPLTDDHRAFVIPYIATADNGLAFLMKELCFRQIDYFEGRSYPIVQYRPGSLAYTHVRETAERYLQGANPLGERHDREDWRRNALADAAKKILNAPVL